MESSRIDKRIEEIIGRKAAEFFVRTLPSRALVTVTGCRLDKGGSEAIVFISVLPESAIPEVIRDTRRLRTELREYLQSGTKIGTVPRIDVVLAPQGMGEEVTPE